MNRVMVIGCPGAGKSTFSRKLHDKTGLELIYLDMLWHKEDRTTVSRDEFDEKLTEILKKDKWIIDGNYQRTLEKRFQCCDTVFLFDLPTELCIDGAKSRIGKKREDMPWVENELDEDFRQWIEDFPKNQLQRIYELCEKYGEDKNIVIFRSREEADEYIENLQQGVSPAV